MVEKGILEAAVKVLVAKEIEEAGRRVGKRLSEAFGQMARLANDTIEIQHDVQRHDGAVVIRVAWASNLEEITEQFVGEQRLDHIFDEGPAEPITSEFNSGVSDHALEPADMEKLADDLATDNQDDDIDEQMIYTGEEEPFELQLDPGDIEMIEEGS